jgi:hypothetical protein
MVGMRQALDPQMRLTRQRTTCLSLWSCTSHAVVKDVELMHNFAHQENSRSSRALTSPQTLLRPLTDPLLFNIPIACEAVENVVISFIADVLPRDHR